MKKILVLFFCTATVFAQTNSPSEADIFYEKAKVIQQGGDGEKLLSAAEQMTKQWPQDARGWNFLGIYHHQKEHVEEAKAFYKRAIELNPKFNAPWGNLGTLYSNAGDHERAITDFKESLRLKPDYGVWLKLGLEQQAIKKFTEAAESFRKATELQPHDEAGWLLLGKTLFDQEHFDETVSAMNQALKIMPRDEDFYTLLINAYRKSGRFTEMMAAWTELAKINPTNLPPPTAITFTNKTGTVISNAEIVKIESSKIIYRTGSAAFDSVKLVDLPEQLQKLFNYDPDKSVVAEKAEQQRRAAVQEQNRRLVAESVYRDKLKRLKEQLIQNSRTIEGEVLQKLPDGLLVDSGAERKRELEFLVPNSTGWREGTKPGAICFGLVLLEDYSNYSGVVDGSPIKVVAYPIGQYNYTTVQNASKTVRKFSTDLSRATVVAVDEGQK